MAGPVRPICIVRHLARSLNRPRRSSPKLGAVMRKPEEFDRRTQPLMREAQKRSAEWPQGPSRLIWETGIDNFLAAEGRMKAKQGRLLEAEADVRRALLNRLKDTGKYAPSSPLFIRGLAGVLGDQGRHAEAEKLVRTAIDVYRTIGVTDSSQSMVVARSHLASILSFQTRWAEANEQHDQIDAAIKDWEPNRAATYRLRPSRILSLYYSDKVETGMALAQELVEREQKRVGDAHRDTAMARGLLAMGLSRLRRPEEALAQFRRAVPALIAARNENPNDDDALAAQDQQAQLVVENYIALLARRPSGRRCGRKLSACRRGTSALGPQGVSIVERAGRCERPGVSCAGAYRARP